MKGYGHLHEETMDKLKIKRVQVFRTDENGTIICTYHGKKLLLIVNQGITLMEVHLVAQSPQIVQPEVLNRNLKHHNQLHQQIIPVINK